MVKWTTEQKKAIDTSGSDILVAAAAGSGKTAVLVERIIQKVLDPQHPVDIDGLLVVTFTNAAAQEMRNRVGEALERALASNPASHHLMRQLSLLQRASISTLHSFCLDTVKKYAYLLDIDPGFRIADDMETDLIQQEVLGDLFEDWYGAEEDMRERFFAVVDRFSSDRSDVDVETLILKLYQFAIQNPWPEQWLDELQAVYEIPAKWTEENLPWLSILKEDIIDQLAAIEDEIKRAMSIARESDGPYTYIETIESDEKMLYEAKESLTSWEDLGNFMQASKFVRLSSKKMECNEEKKEQVKQIRNQYKKRWSNLTEKFFVRNLEGHVADMKELLPIVEQLTALVKDFKSRFIKLKKEKGVVDFSDLEHYCLQLLMDESSTSNQLIPSDVAKRMQEQFTEVLVDEYQDTNLVQETILRLVRKQSGSGNMFMVGDVKQSIYRFRHAEPTLFIDKYKKFSNENDPGERIDLARNFRSRKEVLDATNFIFRQILDEKLGEMNYTRDAELVYGNTAYDEMPFSKASPELIIIDREKPEENTVSMNEESYVDLEKARLEARVYAKKIKEWIGSEHPTSPMQVFDKDKGIQRDIQYRDIVILLRSMTGATTMVDELKKQGIPVYAELSSGYFDAIEIKVMISFLKVIDNPRQDIPLASVLRSPIVQLNEEELTTIRLADKKGTYYDALKTYMKQNHNELTGKLALFLEQFKQFRMASRQGALSELIWKIYRETGFYDFVGGMPGGRQRQANLRALYDRARGYENTSFRGLFRFLRFIERMEEQNDDLGAAKALSEQEDVVRMMTIHKSKGLEFPAVIIGEMGKEFFMKELSKEYLLHKKLGFASNYIDPLKRISYPTLYKEAVKNEKKKELLAEEMRVLYVALTRAREKLVMIGNVPSFDKKKEKWTQMVDHPDWVFPSYFRYEFKTYLDWVGISLMRHSASSLLREEAVGTKVLQEIQEDPSTWKIEVIHGSSLEHMDDTSLEKNQEVKRHLDKWEPVQTKDKALDAFVDERLSYTYPHQEATAARAKQTVTEIKRLYEEKDAYSSDQIIVPFQAPIKKRPTFMQKEREVSAAEKGTAMHTVMQHISFTKEMNHVEIEEFIESLVEKEILRREMADVVDIHAIERFFHSEMADLLKVAPKIYREIPFSLTLPANEVYQKWQSDEEEQILIQGVIDCVIPRADGWIILDYKTDTVDEDVTDDVKGQLKKRYTTQLNLYRKAIETIWKQPVQATYLYFFSKELLLEVGPEHIE